MHRCRLFCPIIKAYTSRWIHTSNKALTLSWRMSLSYKNQSIDLLCKLMGWFLYDKGIPHEKIKTLFTHHTPKICSYMTQSRISFSCLFVFFLSGVFFTKSWFTGQQGKGKIISLTPLYHLYPLHKHLNISKVIAAES